MNLKLFLLHVLCGSRSLIPCSSHSWHVMCVCRFHIAWTISILIKVQSLACYWCIIGYCGYPVNTIMYHTSCTWCFLYGLTSCDHCSSLTMFFMSQSLLMFLCQNCKWCSPWTIWVVHGILGVQGLAVTSWLTIGKTDFHEQTSIRFEPAISWCPISGYLAYLSIV